MSKRDDEWQALLDRAVWGFDGEPRDCSRCGWGKGTGHSPTCPMPEQVIGPWSDLLDRLTHGRVTDRNLDQRLARNRSADTTPSPSADRPREEESHEHRWVNTITPDGLAYTGGQHCAWCPAHKAGDR